MLKQNTQILINEIKSKKELKGLDDAFVLKRLNDSIKHNPLLKDKLKSEKNKKHLLKNKAIKQLIKDIRAYLRLAHGMFQTKESNKISKLLESLKGITDEQGLLSKDSLDQHKKILKAHRSTKERLNQYSTIYNKIFQITKEPKSILDLGCGINPISCIFINHPVKIHSRELSRDDIDHLKTYYEIAGIKGSIKQTDLLTERKFPKADICFMFKVVDVLENQKRGVIHNLLDIIDVRHIVISFATKTLGGKTMRTKRTWFTNTLKHKRLKYETISTENEIFYVITL